MLFRTVLIVISSALTLAAGVPYLRDVWARKTKPRIVTWFVWSLLTGLATAASFSDHQYASAVLTASESLETLAIAVLGVLLSGILTIEVFDVFCPIGALIGLSLWLRFDSPALAVLASIVVDLVGSLPTVKHMWQKPFEETWLTFLLSALSGLTMFVAASDLRITEIASPIDIWLLNALFVAVILGRRRALGRVSAPTGVSVVTQQSALAAPMKLAASFAPQSLTLAWLPVPGAGIYHVYRDGAALGESAGTQFTDANVSNGPHRYQVSAGSATMEGPISDGITVHIRQLPPDLGKPEWSVNPVVSGSATTLLVPIIGRALPVVEGEYFGVKDPGKGFGVPMLVSKNGLSAIVTSRLKPGAYTLWMRARDTDGNWSDTTSTVLNVLPAQPQAGIASGPVQA